jgi:hypothetical protein
MAAVSVPETVLESVAAAPEAAPEAEVPPQNWLA